MSENQDIHEENINLPEENNENQQENIENFRNPEPISKNIIKNPEKNGIT